MLSCTPTTYNTTNSQNIYTCFDISSYFSFKKFEIKIGKIDTDLQMTHILGIKKVIAFNKVQLYYTIYITYTNETINRMFV